MKTFLIPVFRACSIYIKHIIKINMRINHYFSALKSFLKSFKYIISFTLKTAF